MCLCGGLLLGASIRSGAAQLQSRPPANAPRGGSHQIVGVEARPQLFVVLCALDAAGFNADADTANDSPGRVQLRQRMLALKGPAVTALRKYYSEHALGDSGATFSRFVSFALAAGAPPKFEFELRRDELPPDALALEGFNELLANFYREQNIAELWEHYRPDYEAGMDLYRPHVSDLVYTCLLYTSDAADE